MKIVASNSLTVSNVNDGTITHIAYSWSSDGTDRFTTVYPGENLFLDYDGRELSKLNNTTGELFIFPTNTNNAKTITLKPSTKYTVTVYARVDKVTSRKMDIFMVNADGAAAHMSKTNIPLDTTLHKQVFTFTTNSSDKQQYYGRFDINQLSPADSVTMYCSWMKLEEGDQSTPFVPAPTEDYANAYPSYMGTYTDYTEADSTNPSDYSWGPMRGNDGVGIKTTDITYAISTSGTTAPSSGWTSTVPTVAAGSYLWTKTVWAYTDNTSETGYSVAGMGLKGDKGDPGIKGSDGTSGIIVSSVAPASPQTGQLWQDSSTTPQLVKKWTGASWVIWEFYAQNLKSDSLETVSSKIGNIYNDFTLEDGTTGTLHIGNSEYRIESQVLKDNFLFKENIFFDPDGVNFTFEGDSVSNSGYGNYSKSGSDFYLQNNQMASYTVSGIRMSNEFAGYSIKIGDANSKLNFVSENGQGFNFTGPVSFNGIPMNTTSSVTVALFYGITVDFRRQGNLVIASIGRQVRTTLAPGEDVAILEKVPSGYRPSYLHYFDINRNLGSNVLTGLVMGFEPNGDVRVTIGAIETAVFSGSTSYFTEDPLP